MKTWSMAVVAVVILLAGGPVQAAEITVLAGMGVISGVRDLAPRLSR